MILGSLNKDEWTSVRSSSHRNGRFEGAVVEATLDEQLLGIRRL